MKTPFLWNTWKKRQGRDSLQMNDGIVTMLIQWCLLCLIWMGNFDRALQRLGFTRRNALAALTVFFICTFVSWRLVFLPVQVNLSGALLPLLFAGWLYANLPQERRRYLVVIAFFLAFLFAFLRKLTVSDPVLLIADEVILFPLAAVTTIVTVSRNPVVQLFMIMVSLPVADALFATSFLHRADLAQLGSDYAQDLLWCTLALWGTVLVLWHWLKSGILALGGALFPQWTGKSKTHSDR